MNQSEQIIEMGQHPRYPWLDAIRFTAAFLVLVGHTRNDFFMTYGTLPAEQQGIISFLFYSVGRLGHEAVIAFFVISGFLVGGRGLERIYKGSFERTMYAIDRTVRIVIPLVAAIVFCCITYIIIGKDFSYWTVLGNLFSLQGVLCPNLISPFWSLAIEVCFYVLLFSISLIVDKKILASKLSKDFAILRVDLYEVNGKVYFGELTFYHFGGLVPFVPDQWDYILGQYIKLPKNII